MYEYITSDNLENKQTYMYSQYRGYEFLDDYEKSRDIKRNREKSIFREEVDSDSRIRITSLYNSLCEHCDNSLRLKVKQELDFYNKTFEVRKRLYSSYNDNGKPNDEATYRDYDLYVLLGQCLLKGYSTTKCLKYYNCLLKIVDTIMSFKDELSDPVYEDFYKLVQEEKKIYFELIQQFNIRNRKWK